MMTSMMRFCDGVISCGPSFSQRFSLCSQFFLEFNPVVKICWKKKSILNFYSKILNFMTHVFPHNDKPLHNRRILGRLSPHDNHIWPFVHLCTRLKLENLLLSVSSRKDSSFCIQSQLMLLLQRLKPSQLLFSNRYPKPIKNKCHLFKTLFDEILNIYYAMWTSEKIKLHKDDSLRNTLIECLWRQVQNMIGRFVHSRFISLQFVVNKSRKLFEIQSFWISFIGDSIVDENHCWIL